MGYWDFFNNIWDIGMQGRIQGPGCSPGRVHVAPLTYVVFTLKNYDLN